MGDSISPRGFSHKWSRRQFLGIGAGTLGAAVLYPTEISRHELTVEKHEIFLKRLPDAFRGMRIVQISDIHFEEFDEAWFVRHVVDKVNELKPDMVLMTGDFVSYGPFSLKYGQVRANPCAEILSHLQCPLRYASLGNHDAIVGDAIVSDALESHGIPVLLNRSVPLERNGQRIWLAGTGSACASQCRPDTALPKAAIRGQETVLLMAHEPDVLPEMARHGVDMMFSGHTHGGQIRFPFLPAMCLPPYGKKYVEGLFRMGGTQLYVNRGLGAVLIPARLNCPPEITEFTLI